MTKYLRDGVYRYGDDPFGVLGKYIVSLPVNRLYANQHSVEFYSDTTRVAKVYNAEEYSLDLSVVFYRVDNRTYLSKDLITPDLIGKTIKTELGDGINVEGFEVGVDFVTFKHYNSDWKSMLTTAPFEGLGSWWIVEDNNV